MSEANVATSLRRERGAEPFVARSTLRNRGGSEEAPHNPPFAAYDPQGGGIAAEPDGLESSRQKAEGDRGGVSKAALTRSCS